MADGQADQATESPDTFQSGLELATEGIVLLDSRGQLMAMNRRARELFQAPQASLTGTPFWDAVPAPIAEKHRSRAEQVLGAGDSHTFFAHHVFEGQWVEYRMQRHADGLVVNLRDVSETRQALLQLQGSELCNQRLFDANAQAMWLLDTSSRRLLAINQAAASFYGMAQDAWDALLVETLFPDGEGAGWLASLPTGDFQQQMRLCTQRKMNGERVLVELASSRVQWFEHAAVLVSVVDVGARHLADVQLQRRNAALEQRLEQCHAELQRSHQELEAFSYAMSTDLKAPLHVVNGFAKTLSERYSAALDAQGQHYLARIRASTRQLAKLIDDLRTLTHLPRRPLTPELLDLAPVCQRLLDDLRKREPERQLVLEMAETLPLVGDKYLLATALACLIDNAWKFSAKKEQGWIKVGLVPGKSPAGCVLFVSDNGAGFDTAYADKLFTPFQRLHSAADFPGGGLGLAIVKRVAERHGGTAWGVSTDQGGASFFLSLPQGGNTLAPVS